jgi:hypothetical protein
VPVMTHGVACLPNRQCNVLNMGFLWSSVHSGCPGVQQFSASVSHVLLESLRQIWPLFDGGAAKHTCK